MTIDFEQERVGWQAEAAPSAKRYHFIAGMTGLCERFGFYRGEIVPGGLTHSDSKDDCAECKRRVDRELAKRGLEPSSSGSES